MSWLILSLLSLSICSSSVTSYHLQNHSLLTVKRFPQETRSEVLETNRAIKYSNEYGSKFLPLRDAVEARPNIFNTQDSDWNIFNLERQKYFKK